MKNTQCTMDKQTMMNALRSEDFAVYEAALYLNTHPDCTKALEYFCMHKEKAANLRREYEALWGPLTVNAVTPSDAWQWIQCPWPWEKEAN